MFHKQRWTPKKIKQRLELIAPLVHIKRKALPSFKYLELSGPTIPDPMADYGEHQFTYSLYPHAGSWNEETQREAYLLNDPVIVYKSKVEGQRSNATHIPSLVTCDAPHIIIETTEQAEDGNELIIRLYESQRKRGQVKVQFGSGVDSVWTTNLLEENESALNVHQDSIILNMKPYQIVTLRVKFK